MAKIKINAEAPLYNGMPVTFKAPCDCSIVDGLSVQYGEDNQQFVFTDAHGNELTGIGNLFGKDAVVKAVLDTDKGRAFVQNADTNAYLEDRLNKTVSSINGQRGDVIFTAQSIGAAAAEEMEIDVTYEQQTGGSTAEPIWTVRETAKGIVYISGNHFVLKVTLCLTGGNINYSVNAGALPRGSQIIGLYCAERNFTMLTDYNTDTRIYIYESGNSKYYTLYLWGVISGAESGGSGGGSGSADWVQALIETAQRAEETANDAKATADRVAAQESVALEQSGEAKTAAYNATRAAQDAQNAASVAVDSAAQALENSQKLPYPQDGVWHVWNGKEYVATNAPSKGDKGEKGDQGIQGVKGDQGDKGDKGDTGENGKTPLRGVDYWTEADKTEIVNETAENIPTASADTRGVVKIGNGLKMDGETLNFDNGKWECIEKICFGYELLTEKPDDWDTAKTTKYYYAATGDSCKILNCNSWDTWMPNRYWKYTGEYDTQIQRIERNKEPDGTPYDFKCVAVIGHLYNTVTAGIWCLNAYLSDFDFQNRRAGIYGVVKFDTQSNGYPYHMAYKIEQSYGVYELTGWYGNQGNFTARTGIANASPDSLMRPVSDGNIRGIAFHIYSAKEYYSEGDYIEIWGVRADG